MKCLTLDFLRFFGLADENGHVRWALAFYLTVVAEGAETTFLWYNLAAMQSPAATAASQKDHWNPADRRTVRVMPEVNGIGTVLVADPIKGRLMLNTA